ncbi:two-component system sensor histidine kinase YesM [Paenibacillus pabuli]|uniref:Two-component system sensor histidine kinase YesM n=1 Tax=Paenibacillus pabuli TaxID=1472 RepID=A0ABX9BMW7_9BACL|nr:sensor histidine kinase [Paenibacillus pabuli]RAI98336.1 two-component system sensor histidine kinase YesM [Paenibacillus pabuli]
MRKWLYSTTFRKRIQLSLILFTVIAVIVCGGTSYFIASRVLENKSYSLNQGIIDKSAQSLEEKLRKIRLAVLTFMSSDQFNQLLKQTAKGEELSYYDHFKLNQSLQTPIFQMKLIEPGITSIMINTPVGEYFSNPDKRTGGVPFTDSTVFPFLEKYHLPGWVESHSDDLFGTGQKVLSLMFVPIVQNAPADTHIVVDVSESALKEYLLKNSGDAIPVVFTENGKLAFEADSLSGQLAADTNFKSQLKDSKGHFEYTLNNIRYLVNYSTVAFPDNWLIVHLTERNVLLKDVRLIQLVTISVIVIFVLLALLISRKLTSLLLRPLNHLQSVMKKVEHNDWSVRFEGEYKDEFTHVGLRFNSMLDQIENLIRERMDAQHAERIAEMKALQAQMNPHFLYNTLNTILWKSHSNKQEEVREMIMSLSALFRVGLNNGEELTTVAKELEHVSQYLKIQKLCYASLFEYTIECEEEIKQLPTLKLLLQPLVENSILHGFKDYRTEGEIHIEIMVMSGFLRMLVTDNGQGFNVHEHDINDPHFDVSECEGFALRNIGKRLSLYYGNKAKFNVSSTPYQKTRIEILIPLEIEGAP